MKKMPYIMEMLIALVILPVAGFVDDQGGHQQAADSVSVQAGIISQEVTDHPVENIPSLVVGVLFDL